MPVRRLVPRARPATRSARLVTDLEPGRVTQPTSGWVTGVMLAMGSDMADLRSERQKRVYGFCRASQSESRSAWRRHMVKRLVDWHIISIIHEIWK